MAQGCGRRFGSSEAMRQAWRSLRPGCLALGAHLSRPLATCEPKDQSLEQFLKSSKAQKWIELNSDKAKSCALPVPLKSLKERRWHKRCVTRCTCEVW